QQHQDCRPADFEDARSACARGQDELGLGGICAHRRSEFTEAAAVARLLGGFAPDDAVRQRVPRGPGPGSSVAGGDGTRAEAGLIQPEKGMAMRSRGRIWPAVLVALVVTFAGAGAGQTRPLKILLTNDDGFDANGLQVMQAALAAAGH